jgi:hypothetical protein
MESDRKEIIVHGTLEQYRAFVDGTIWQDFQSSFEAWLSDIRDGLEAADDVRSVAILQGNAAAIRRVLNLPSVIVYQIKEQLGIEEVENGEEQY